MSRRLRPLLLGFVVILLDCAALDRLPETTCGNGVIDATEDCDTFPNDPKDTTKARCGAPTEGEFACHLRCGAQANGTTLACPDGWGCNVKGICREPTGTFQSALGAVSGGVNQLTVGDFDGDGRRDLIGFGPRNTSNASRLRVHYFDDNGALTQVAVLPGQSVSPVVFDHDHNGRDDIAFGIASPFNPGALGVVSGLADKTFLPVVFPAVTLADVEAAPAFVFPRADVKLPNAQPDAVLLIARDTPTHASLTSLDAEVGGTTKLDRTLPLGPEAARGRVTWGPMFAGNPLSTCGELVVAMQPDGDVPGVLYVLSPCTFRIGGKIPKWDSDSADGFKTFPINAALGPESRGALIADVDDDGHLDVLIDTKDGPYVAYGDPSGTTLLAPRQWTPDGAARAMPVTTGDLDLDGRTDFVFTTSVAVKKPVGGGAGGADAGSDAGAAGNRDGMLYETKEQAQSWTDAAIGNFNADGYPDLVTARVGSPDIQVVAGGPAGITVTTITTDGKVEAIEKGDFDGDHIDDLAITQSTSVSGTSDLSIAYGRAFGGLEAPTRIGSVDTPRGLRAAPHGSSPTDLGVYAYAKALNAGKTYHTTSFTLLTGSGDRQPIAPLLFIESLSCTRSTDPCQPPPRTALPGNTGRLWQPLSLAAGHFLKTDESAVLAYALGLSAKATALGAWVADADPGAPGGLDAPVEREVLDGTLDVLDASGFAKIATATGNIDGADKGGLEKIVAISNAPGSADGVLVVVDPTMPNAPPAATVLPGLQVVPGAQLALADLDGDGLRDVVATFGAPPDVQIYAFLNRGKGTFAVPGIKVTFPPAAPGATSEGAPVAFAPLNIRGAPATGGSAQPKALAILTEHSVAIATLRGDKQGFDVSSLAPLLGNGVTNATGIAAGDFNGDGVDDIAIADGSVRLLLQIPRSAK